MRCSTFLLLLSLCYRSIGVGASDDLRQPHLAQSADIKSDSFIELSLKHWFNNPRLSRSYGEKAFELAQNERDTSGMSTSLRLIGVSYYLSGLLDDALAYSLRSSELAEKIGDSILIRKSYNNIGLIYHKMGVNNVALEYLLNAEIILLKSGSYQGYSDLLNIIGLVHFDSEEVSLAITYFKKAIKIATEEDYDDIVDAYIYLGVSQIKQGHYSRALGDLKNAFVMANSDNNSYAEVRASQNMGDAHRMLKNYDSARLYLDRALNLSAEINDREGNSNTYRSLSRLSADEGDISGAITYLRKSESTIQSLESYEKSHLENYRLMANAYRTLSQWDSVSHYLEKILVLQNELIRKSAKANYDLVPIKIKYEEDQLAIVRREERLRNIDFRNRVYLAMLVGASLFLFVLFMILRLNTIARKELASTNKKLVRTRDLLIRSEKMASIGTLVSGMGHEINNPLNFIQNGFEHLFKLTKGSLKTNEEELEEVKGMISEGIERVSNIVSGLTKLYTLSHVSKQTCDLIVLMNHCLESLINKLEGIEVRSNLKGPLYYLANDELVKQLFHNILTNAIHAINKAGRSGIITISMNADKDEIIVIIEDNGVGIAKENLLKICDPFFTTKPPGKGVGLGLYIAQLIVDEHKGIMDISSKESFGTKVSISFLSYSQAA